jgi:hypothetical protein
MKARSRAVAAGCAALLFAGCPSSNPGPHGTVVDLAGHVSAGQTVVLTSGSFTKTQVSDDAGTFSMEGVPTPYTATVVDSGGEVVTAYQGLTRPDPTLTDILTPPSTRGAILSGQFSGGSFPVNGLDTMSLLFASPEVVQALGMPIAASYLAHVTWAGPATTTGTLYAIQVHNGPEGPLDYPGFGARDNVTLQDTGTLNGQDIALSEVTMGTVSGTVTAATGYSFSQQSLQLLVAPTVAVPLYSAFPSSASNFSYTTPSIFGTQVLLGVSSRGPTGQEYVAAQMAFSTSASDVSLTLPAAPTLDSPDDGATGVSPSITFIWTDSFVSGVHLFQVYSGEQLFTLVTAASSASLSDFVPVGPLSSTRYSWDVIDYAPAYSVDTIAGAGGLYTFLFGTVVEGQSAPRTFTTAP